MIIIRIYDQKPSQHEIVLLDTGWAGYCCDIITLLELCTLSWLSPFSFQLATQDCEKPGDLFSHLQLLLVGNNWQVTTSGVQTSFKVSIFSFESRSYMWIWLIILPQRILLNCCKSDRKNHSTHANTSKIQHKGFIEVIIQLYGPRSPPNPHKPSYFIKAVSVVTGNSLHNGTSGGSEPPIYHLRQGSESVDQWKIKYNCKFKFGQYSRKMTMLKLQSRVEFKS